MTQDLVLDEVSQANEDPFAVLNGLLNDHNAAQGAPWQHTPLWLFARDAAGKVQGGIRGSTYWSWCSIDVLAVAEPYRGKGIGTALLRKAEEIGAPGNRVSLWLVPLPSAERNARRRFARIHATTEELKRDGQATGGAVIAEAANWAGGAVVEQAARLLGSVRIYNLIVTNVPGPAVALHLAGSRLREVYPHLPLFVGSIPQGGENLVAAIAQHRAVVARVRAMQRVSGRRWNLILDDGVVVKLP